MIIIEKKFKLLLSLRLQSDGNHAIVALTLGQLVVAASCQGPSGGGGVFVYGFGLERRTKKVKAKF